MRKLKTKWTEREREKQWKTHGERAKEEEEKNPPYLETDGISSSNILIDYDFWLIFNCISFQSIQQHIFLCTHGIRREHVSNNLLISFNKGSYDKGFALLSREFYLAVTGTLFWCYQIDDIVFQNEKEVRKKNPKTLFNEPLQFEMHRNFCWKSYFNANKTQFRSLLSNFNDDVHMKY